MRWNNYCPSISMEIIFMNTENSKTNGPNKFVLKLSQILDIRRSNKHVALQNVSIYYMWKNIRKQYNYNKLKIITPTSNGEFELPDGFYSVSGIKDYVKYIIKKHETLRTIPLIPFYINIIDNS